MFQVRCFEYDDEEELEEAVNEFLQENSECELIDIKYSSSIAVGENLFAKELLKDVEEIEELADFDEEELEADVYYSFSALIVYQIK
ncbi:sporulation protein Cse60 (plasmid) [Rossellomorea sp. AcN35-11]|nr:sporulation protein Cse60 [Rossellomorea aquimaris]WJV32100.1 sporulation protein Cse60 [Rossellomorea sp. AcN35-11]